MSEIRVNNIIDEAGTGAPTLPNGVTIQGNTTGTNLTLSGDLTVNGTTTTIDTAVTSVDSLSVDGEVIVGAALSAAGQVIVGAGLSVAGTTKFSGPLTEKCNRDTGAGLTGNYNHDLITYGNVHWATSNSSGTWTYNLRGSATVALNDMMSDGETLSFQLISAQNNASYYMTEFRIDGTAHTVWWSGGAAPTAGNASGYDVYTFTVFKIGNASFRTFAALSNHA